MLHDGVLKILLHFGLNSFFLHACEELLTASKSLAALVDDGDSCENSLLSSNSSSSTTTTTYLNIKFTYL
jgi:hypothetical protein